MISKFKDASEIPISGAAVAVLVTQELHICCDAILVFEPYLLQPV